MAEERKRTLIELLQDNELITAAIGRAVREAVLSHARDGYPIVVSRDGQIVWLQPAEVFALYGVSPPAGNKHE
jgi:hypothetical protein